MTAQAVWEDSFSGTANTFLEARTPTKISDDTALPAEKWTMWNASRVWLAGSHNIEAPIFNNDPFAIYTNAVCANRTQTVSIRWTQGASFTGTYGVFVCGDPLTDSYYYVKLLPASGAGNWKLQLLYHINNLDGTLVAPTALSYAVVATDTLDVTLICVDLGASGVSLTVNVSHNSGADINNNFMSFSPNTTQYIISNPGTFGIFMSPSNATASAKGYLSNFTATYTPGTPVAATPAVSTLNMLYVGDSNGVLRYSTSLTTASTYRSFAAQQFASPWIQAARPGYSAINIDSYASSGTTSGDFAGNTNTSIYHDYFRFDVLRRILQNNVKVAWIQLGVNDSKTTVATSAAQYKTNLQSVINIIKQSGVKIVLMYPPYNNATTGGFAVPASQTSLVSYQAQIDSLIDNVQVFGYGPGVSSTTDITQANLYSWISGNTADIALDGIHYAKTLAGSADAGRMLAQAAIPAIPPAPRMFTRGTYSGRASRSARN